MTSVRGGFRLRAKRAWRPAGAAAMVIALTGLSAGLAAQTAGAATVRTGTLALTPARATAGDTADVFTFTYTAPAKPGTGSISIDVPAGFSPPQDASPSGAGYLSVSSACGQFQVTGVTSDGAGGNTVTVAENCAAGRQGTLIYSQVTVPTTARAYPVATSFTPTGGAAVPFANQHTVTVRPGALASVTVSPATATIAVGGSQGYTASGSDAYGNALGPITNAKFTIKPDGSCAGATCTASVAGTHTVTATSKKITGTATLTVGSQADLAVTEQASSALPFYGTQVTFTTTVTNTSTTATSSGVSVTVAAPAALTSPSVTASAGSYAGSTWTVGTLAPGASATLAITGLAGDVDAGLQTVTATATSATPDPNTANNTASVSEKSQPAPVNIAIVPDPGNPVVVDISAPGNIGWTGAVDNAENPALAVPAADTSLFWTCATASQNPCPLVAGLEAPSDSLTFQISSLALDTYSITLTVTLSGDNYTFAGGGTEDSTMISFSTTTGGG